MRILIIFLFLGMVSCKSEVEKLDINDVESHRAYQDTLISNAEFPNGKLDVIRNLISQYTNLKDNKEYSNNSNYNYYLGRLYSYIYSLPIYGLFYDSTSSRLLNYNLYKNFVDSAYYYSEKSLAIDSNNILSMLAYTRSLFWERENYLFFKENGLETKFSGNVDSGKMKKRVEYLLNNFSKFSVSDTSKEKRVSRKIYEMSFTYLNRALKDKINSGINWENQNDLSLLIFTRNCISFLKPYKTSEIDQNFFSNAVNYLNPYINKAEMVLKQNELINSLQDNNITKNFLDKKLIIMYGPEDRYVIFKGDGTVEISIQTCDEGGVFGGGSDVNTKLFYGNYTLEGSQYVNVNLPSEINFECNNGYKERWSKNLKFIFNDLRDDHLGVSLYSGVEGYQLPANKRWREWVDLNLAYYLNPYF